MFAKSLIESVDEVHSKPPKRLKNTLTVDTLSKNSLADVAGLEAGDILLTVNNQPSDSIDLTQASIDHDSIHYTFFRPGKNIAINLKTNAAPLGVKFVKSDETVLDEYSSNSDMADHKDLYPIWNNVNSKLLKEITLKEISPFIMSALSLINKLYYSPEYLFYGAALYDMGNREAGMKIIKRFEFCQPETHTQEQDAVVKYYYAKELLHNNEKEEGD